MHLGSGTGIRQSRRILLERAVTSGEGMLLTVKQVSERLNCSKALVYALCGQGLIKHIRFGLGRGTIRIEENDLLDFIELSKTASSTPPDTVPLSKINYSGRVSS
jgi:excisionase family DNA binding protein